MQNTDIDNDIEYDNDIEMKRGVWGEKQRKNGLLKRLFQ